MIGELWYNFFYNESKALVLSLKEIQVFKKQRNYHLDEDKIHL